MRKPMAVLFLLGAVSLAMGKTERSYFTAERVAAAKYNIEHYDWAKAELQTILEAAPAQHDMLGNNYVGANKFVNKTDDELSAIPPPIAIPRMRDSAATAWCPVHGADIRRYSGYCPWLLDFEKYPYKVKCPVGGELYPSNDFAAGEMTGGDYPDDGSGYTADGRTYSFIRYYVHSCYNAWITPGINGLATAYLLTDDARYGHKAAVLMAALASQYPGPTYNSQYCYAGEYGRRSGMVTDYIWENIKLVDLAKAYDALYPIYDRDPELLQYLKSKGCIDETVGDDAAGARKYVEDRIMRQAMQALLDQAIQGNPGHHQLAALTLALVMDDTSDVKASSRDLVRFAYYGGYAPAAWIFSNAVTRDGGGYEGPGYDRIKFNYIAVGKLMEELRARHPELYPETEFPSILQQTKARRMYDFFIEVTSLGFFTPPVGDAGGARLRPGIIPRRYYTYVPAQYVDGFRLYGDPRYARALLGLDGKMPQVDLFEPSIEEQAREAAALPEAAINSETRLLDHYGFAYLHGGEAGRYEREACINYTALRGHQQYDYLSLYLFAHEQAHLPDLGYPYSWQYRWQWDANIYGHNTVAVDGCTPLWPHAVPRGWVSLIGDRLGVQAAAVAHEPYRYHPQLEPDQPPVKRYERICVMVEEDEHESYLLDLFVVQGGKRHDQSWHSVLRDPKLPDLDWVDQQEGTAAGPDVPYDGKYTNVRGQETQDALCYVTGVKRATLKQHSVFEWEYGLNEPTGLRLHLVPVDGERQLIFGTGRSPARPEEWHLPYVFVRDEGDEGLATRFLTILEPYRGEGQSRVNNVTATGTWPLKITVERGDAVDEINIYAPSEPDGIERGKQRDIGISVRTISGGKQTRSVTFGRLPGSEEEAILRGEIVSVDREADTITVSGKLPTGRSAPRHIRIFNSGRSSMYAVVSAQAGPGDTTVVRLEETALLGRGIPVGYREGRIDNDICLPFATGRVDAEGNLADFACRFAGARVESEDGAASLLLRGVNGAGWITGTCDYDLYLQDAVPPAQLEKMFGTPGGARPFSIYDYGAGDSYEVMLCRAAQ